MNNLNALRGKHNKTLASLQGDPFKNARKLFFFDQKISQEEESTNQKQPKRRDTTGEKVRTQNCA